MLTKKTPSTKSLHQDLNSSILFIGTPDSNYQFEATYLSYPEEVLSQVSNLKPQVILIEHPTTPDHQCYQILRHYENLSPYILFIIVILDHPPINLIELTQIGNLYKVVNKKNIDKLNQAVTDAIEKYSYSIYNENLSSLLTEKITHLTKDLIGFEKKIQIKKQNINRSKKRFTTTLSQLENMKESLIAIHQSKSISEMETPLTNVLKFDYKLDWTHIAIEKSSSNQPPLDLNKSLDSIFSVPLISNRNQIGTLSFGRKSDLPFLNNEKNFLQQISDTVTLSLDRLLKLEELSIIKQQWDYTFNAITSPLCLTDSFGVILRTNKSFNKASNNEAKNLIGKECFKSLFTKNIGPIKPYLGKKFKLPKLNTFDGSTSFYELKSYPIYIENLSLSMFVNLFNDVTQKEDLQLQILQSAKLAELGTIGSSMAHELNNPLGGVISFLQLIKMEIESNDSIYSDILEMEKGALRCKEIIQNLLSYSRIQNQSTHSTLNLNKVIEKAICIIEIKSKSLGLTINLKSSEENALIKGFENKLTQCFCNILNYALIYFPKETPLKEYNISIQLNCIENQLFVITLICPYTLNQDHLNDENEINLLSCRQILEEHNGKLDIEVKTNDLIEYKVSLPKKEIE